MDLFERAFTVSAEDLELELRGQCSVPWSDFLLNPRRLRGSDFLMRWSQGVWSEQRLLEAVNDTEDYFALPYGPSGTAPRDDPREVELYFERLEEAGLGELKRPDLLILPKSEEDDTRNAVAELGGERELPFTPEDQLREIVSRAILGVECENSLWRCADMPDYGSELRAMRRLGGKPGLPKNAVLPTVILKEEDRQPLLRWEQNSGVDIHIWHVFYDLAFGLALEAAQRLVADGLISPTEQVFQAPGGATTTKTLYKFYYHYAYPVGSAQEEPQLVADYLIDKNGHVLPYVKFSGGRLKLAAEVLDVLAMAGKERR